MINEKNNSVNKFQRINQKPDKETEESSFEIEKTYLLLATQNSSINQFEKCGIQLKIIMKICEGTGSSDKFVRLSSSIIKFLKNFKIVETKRLDKLAAQIGLLRRLLRLNRLGTIIKDWINFIQKKQKIPREMFDNCFKILMFLTDTADTLLYLMQHQVLKQRNTSTLKKIVIDFYFYECVVWLLLHLYEFYFHKEKFKNQQQRRNKQLLILKYFVDTITSHNDWSKRCSTMDMKSVSALGLFSSVLGLYMIWK